MLCALLGQIHHCFRDDKFCHILQNQIIPLQKCSWSGHKVLNQILIIPLVLISVKWWSLSSYVETYSVFVLVGRQQKRTGSSRTDVETSWLISKRLQSGTINLFCHNASWAIFAFMPLNFLVAVMARTKNFWFTFFLYNLFVMPDSSLAGAWRSLVFFASRIEKNPFFSVVVPFHFSHLFFSFFLLDLIGTST